MKREINADLFKLADAYFENLIFDGNCEYGSVGTDCKRPFGDSSVDENILRIIGWKPEGNDREYSIEQEDYARELYSTKLIPFLKDSWNRFRKTQVLIITPEKKK